MTAQQHPKDEFCFHCVPDEIALEGIASYDNRTPYEGPTVHWQVPESFCPRFAPSPSQEGGTDG